MIQGRNIVIKLEGDKLLLPTMIRKEVELPANAPSNAFLMCRVVSYDETSGTLNLKRSRDLINYSHFIVAIEENSDLLLPLNIIKVNFVDLPSPSTSSNRSKANTNYKKDFSYKESLVREEYETHKNREENRKIVSKEKETVNIQIELSVNDLKFLDGKVCFEYYISQLHRKASFEITHSFIKKEFDSIKNYFPKVLKISKFGVRIQFEHLDGKLLNHECTSPHILMINDSIFEMVEDLYISDYIVNSSSDEISSLDEIALEASKEIGSDSIKDPNWLLDKLLAEGKTKHYYHLRYLSDKHTSTAFNLKLTGKPLSFIFLLTTPNGFCLIWETYSTDEATYVWKVNNLHSSHVKSTIEEIVDRIKWLRNKNKMGYLKEKPDNFLRIEHHYFGDDWGFKKWKMQLENFILKK